MQHHPTLRRNRISSVLRQALKEFRWHPSQLIAPLFVGENHSAPIELKGIQGQFVHTRDSLLSTMGRMAEKGIRSFILFGVPSTKSPHAHQSIDPNGVMAKALKAVHAQFGTSLFTWADVCLCSYTDTGQCGFVHPKGFIDNVSTVQHLAKLAVHYAEHGALGIAPSDMMDGRIAAIRASLDEAGLSEVPIMSYAAKFASQFYGPFREAAQSTPKKTENGESPRADYQIEPSRLSDAIQSAKRDAAEGADILMVKPGLPYLDVISRLKSEVQAPLAVYQVSGEYAALKMLASAGYGNEWALFHETIVSFLRAGAQLVLTYAAETLVDGMRTGLSMDPASDPLAHHSLPSNRRL